MAASLPLFPLNVPLVPGLVLPLHVFEPRYRQLVSDLLAVPDEDAREFGIVGIRDGRSLERDGMNALFPVGVSTILRQVEPLDDGRFDIVTTGSRRFRVVSIDTSTPLVRAEVDFLDEVTSPADEPLAASVAQAFRAYRIVLGGQVDEAADDDGLSGSDDSTGGGEEDLPDDPTVMSFLVTAAMVLPPAERQSLLAAETVAQRLRLAMTLLRRECAVIATLSAMPSLEPLGPLPSPN